MTYFSTDLQPRSGIIQNAPTIDPMPLTQGYSGNQSISDVNPQFDYGFLNTMPFSDPSYATQEFWSLPAALNSHPSASDFETPHEYFGVLDNPNSYTASLQEANEEENKKLTEILFGELIRDHPDEADSVNDETITPPQSPPANTIGDTENLTLEPQTHNQGSGAPSLAPHQAWPVQSQHQSSTQPPPAISHLPPTYYAADYVPAWGNYCAAALSDPPQGSSSSNSILNHPHTEDLELWISLEDPSTPYQNSTGNILPDDPLDYDKLWNML
ncbi:hypothetical protein FS749_001308 [Ceratobasidium sp. UAMH 11750]|nr:hypothetical protein FS749_001308 [Ceratobasidium sp. UAMH 11750]